MAVAKDALLWLLVKNDMLRREWAGSLACPDVC